MNLSPLQLECMKLGADKTLSFGCLLNRISFDGSEKIYYCLEEIRKNKIWIASKPFGAMEMEFDKDMISNRSGDKYDIIGHPITRGRLCYLRRYGEETPEKLIKFHAIGEYIIDNDPILYNQTILERPEELILLVRDFLLSLQ